MSARAILVLCALCLNVALAQKVGDPTTDLDKLSPDELFSVQVTSVGRKAQPLSKAAAAVFVLTAEDIRRSGATSIPEALRWVPGLTVLSVDGRSWVISARGDARLYADKILVMIDGRSLYTPMFSGVLWDTTGVPREDIERIEVVRGPGAVMAHTHYEYLFDRVPVSLPHQGSVRLQHNLGRAWKADLMASARPRDRNLSLPGVLPVDARIAWRPARAAELRFSVRNLADRRVPDCYSEGPTVTLPLRPTFVFQWSQHV